MEFDLLTRKQLKSMQVFKKYGSPALITDYATYLGGRNISGYGDYYTKQTVMGEHSPKIGIRPVGQLPDDLNITDHRIVYGEYPQSMVDPETEKKLFNAIVGKDIFLTGKNYTYLDKNDNPVKVPEYRYNGKKYACVTKRLDRTWFNVEPIVWLVDKETNSIVSKKILVAGVRYNDVLIFPYKLTIIKKYLDDYFANEIYESGITIKEKEVERSNKIASLIKTRGEIVDKLSKVSLLQVVIKTDIVVNGVTVTEEMQEVLNKARELDDKLQNELRKINQEINSYNDEVFCEAKVLTKKLPLK